MLFDWADYSKNLFDNKVIFHLMRHFCVLLWKLIKSNQENKEKSRKVLCWNEHVHVENWIWKAFKFEAFGKFNWFIGLKEIHSLYLKNFKGSFLLAWLIQWNVNGIFSYLQWIIYHWFKNSTQRLCGSQSDDSKKLSMNSFF